LRAPWARSGATDWERRMRTKVVNCEPSSVPKDRVLVNDTLKFANRRVAINREKRACSHDQLRVATQDRGKIIGEVCSQGRFVALSASQPSVLVCAPVTHPFVFARA
jgi:hypothetical protein